MKILKEFENQFTIPVLRHKNGETLERIALALAEGGLKVLELTLMSEEAFQVIEKLSKNSNLIIGAGTILNTEHCKKAVDAGAKFLVSPGLDPASVELAKQNGVPFFPGVLTPSEIMKAQNLGCELVKVFPIANVGGPNYLKSLQGPFPEMKWMVTGGVTMEDYQKFADHGAHCVGIGNQITPSKLVETKNWKELTALAAMHLKVAQQTIS